MPESPVTMFTVPGGKPASSISSARRSADSGVCSAGLSTTVQPAAGAGATFQAAIVAVQGRARRRHRGMDVGGAA